MTSRDYKPGVESIGAGWSAIHRWENGSFADHDGYVVTPHGIVLVFACEPCLDDKNWKEGIVQLKFAYRGQMFRRHWNRFYSRPYIVTLAKRFAREIAGRKI